MAKKKVEEAIVESTQEMANQAEPEKALEEKAEKKPARKRASSKKTEEKSEESTEEQISKVETEVLKELIPEPENNPAEEKQDAEAAPKKKTGRKKASEKAPSNEEKAEPEIKKPRRIGRRLKPYTIQTMEEKRQGAEREVRSIYGESTDDIKETLVGLPSEEILKANQKFMTSDEEREQNLYKELIRYQKYGEILWGTLVSVEDDPESNTVYAYVLWNDIMVKIPDYLFLEPTYRFGVSYEKMSEKEKMRRRHSTITFMLGAKVCFVVTTLNRELIRDKYDALYNTYELTVEGSRCKAMEIMRDIFFFHENRKDAATRTAPREIIEGDILNARVIQVKEESVLVECGGVETRIAASLLSARDYYTNCTDAYSSGDMMKVRVKKVYVNKEDHTVHLSLTGQVVNPAKAIKDVKIGSAYLGTVASCNEKSHTYTVMLSNGVPCTVLFEFVFGHIPLVKGDKVRVTVKNIYSDKGVAFVAGAAQKL